MSYTMTDHARERMSERKIDEHTISEAIRYGKNELSKSGSGTAIYVHNNIKVVTSKKDSNLVIVTVFRDENFARQQAIDDLKIEADQLASTFKSLYSQATDAYEMGHRADAKELSLRAKDLQSECECLNQAIKGMY